MPGGYLGVDVFFVVSGFLITTLLLRELGAHGRLSLPAFWTRRARRLLPALGLVVVTSIIAARLVDRDLLVGIRRQALGAATFTTNWVEIAAGTDYFDERQPQLLKPLWSLAIEEQFYLLWPALLVVGVVAARSWGRLARVATVGALASAVAMGVLSLGIEDPTRVYYGTDTHAFGLLLGAAAAFARQDGAVLMRPAAARWAPLAAVGGLGLLALTMHADGPLTYRGGLLLSSGLAVVAVAGCTAGRSGYLRALDARPLRWIGERSYGLYLWHWPVLIVVTALIVAPERTGRWWAGVGDHARGHRGSGRRVVPLGRDADPTARLPGHRARGGRGDPAFHAASRGGDRGRSERRGRRGSGGHRTDHEPRGDLGRPRAAGDRRRGSRAQDSGGRGRGSGRRGRSRPDRGRGRPTGRGRPVDAVGGADARGEPPGDRGGRGSATR